MFPTLYLPGLEDTSEDRINLDFYAISSGPDLGGITDPNSASVFFAYEVNQPTSIVGYPSDFLTLAPYANKKEVRFGVGSNLRFYSLMWDKGNTFLAVGFNDSVNPVIYRSADKGDTWTDVTSTFISAGMIQKSLAVNGAGYVSYRTQINSYVPKPGVFLVGVPTGPLGNNFKMLRSADKGITWSDVTAAYQAYYPFPLTSNPYTTWVDDTTFYVGYNYNEYISTTDGGISWSAVALPSTLLFSSAGILYKYNNRWQARNVFNNGLAEATALSSNPVDWANKSFGLSTSIPSGLGYGKLPNLDEGMWQNVNTLGSNQGYRIENGKYKINSALNPWSFVNTFGDPGIRVSYQANKPKGIKLLFTPFESQSTNTTTKSYRFGLWFVTGSPGSLTITYSLLTSTAQWTTGGFTRFALDPENLTFNGAVTGSFLGK